MALLDLVTLPAPLSQLVAPEGPVRRPATRVPGGRRRVPLETGG